MDINEQLKNLKESLSEMSRSLNECTQESAKEDDDKENKLEVALEQLQRIALLREETRNLRNKKSDENTDTLLRIIRENHEERLVMLRETVQGVRDAVDVQHKQLLDELTDRARQTK